jgi:hypothetical protein
MRASTPTARSTPNANRTGLFWDLLTFDRLMTGPVIHLIYWCGLGLIALLGFGVIGAAVGVAIRGGAFEGVLLAIPVLVGGVLTITALALLWRGACEFYMAVFRIADDLRVLREAAERRAARAQARTRAAPAP